MLKKIFIGIEILLISVTLSAFSGSTKVSYAVEQGNLRVEDNNSEISSKDDSKDSDKDESKDKIKKQPHLDETQEKITQENKIKENKIKETVKIDCNELINEDIKELSIFNKYGKVLKMGDKGEIVKSLNLLLKWLNYNVDETSSEFTEETKEAVFKFQKDHFMKEIGVVDKLTYIRLNDYIYNSNIKYKPIEYNVKMGSTDDYWIIVNKTTNVLQLYKGADRLRVYPIATGRCPSFTPEGKFTIANKVINARWKEIPGGVATNPLGSHWMGLKVNNNWWSYGIHGCGRPESIGTYASAGCIRMYNFHSQELYNIVPVNTPVWIGTTEKIKQWVMELNKKHEEIKIEEAKVEDKKYEDVIKLILTPYINETLTNYYGYIIPYTLKTVELISITPINEQKYTVTLNVELFVRETKMLIGKDIITYSIDSDTIKMEEYEHIKCEYEENNNQ
jgi:hypothetical protein